MIYLVLAITCSTVISVIMRSTESRRSSAAGFSVANYIVCIALSALYIPKGSAALGNSGTGLALILGTISGILYLLSLVIHMKSIEKNGVVLSSVFMRLGIVVTVLMSIFVFGEHPGLKQIAGIILAVSAIVILNFDKEGLRVNGSVPLLFILFSVSGATECMLNIYDNTGNPELGSTYLLTTFSAALVSAAVLWLSKKEKISRYDILFGALLGIPNYYSSRFMMLALKEVPNVIAYPLYSVLTIVATGTIGVLVFKEKLTALKIAGLAAVICALVLLQ